MDITTLAATPPAPGSTNPGDLYVDLQSRTVWLGVDSAVDPAEAVLVSDIVALLANDTTTLTNAKAYTDAQITTRAPLSHTHTAAQITNFSAAVTTVVAGIPGFNWVSGMIMMWGGSLAEIGVGNLAGWVLCDGSNGAPDLRDRFVIGAGNKPVGNKNTPVNFNVSDAGAHAHAIDAMALTAAQMPVHNHPLSGSVSGTTGFQNANHAHGIAGNFFLTSSGGTWGGDLHSGGDGQAGYATYQVTAAENANHGHAFSATLVATMGNTGGGATHTHTEQSAGSHNHVVTAAQVRDTVPYYALAYIYKL